MKRELHAPDDWNATLEPGISGVIANAARRVHWQGEWLDREDLQQEAVIALATKQRHRNGLSDDPQTRLRRLSVRMTRVMLDVTKTRRKRQELETSLDELQQRQEDGGLFYEAQVLSFSEMPSGDTYTTPEIRALLVAMFEGSETCWGGVASPGQDQGGDSLRAQRCSPSMTTSIVDVRRAWERALLSNRQREALLLEATGHTQREIGARLGVSQNAVADRIRRGLITLADYLNGELDPPENASSLAA